MLSDLLRRASLSDWSGAPADDLAIEIENHIVASIPLRLQHALGADEARQRARVIAWERCRRLSDDPPSGGLQWGYLANFVRWKLADAVRAEALRRQRHPVIDYVPDRATPELRAPLGQRLDTVTEQLVAAGLDRRVANSLVRAAVEGPRFERRRIAERVEWAGGSAEQAQALALLLRGGPRCDSVIARLTRGQTAAEVFTDPSVARRIATIARSPRSGHVEQRDAPQVHFAA